MQLASIIGTDVSCIDWEGRYIFENIVPEKPVRGEPKFINWDVVLNSEFENLSSDYDYHIDDPAYLLHNTFNRITKKDPREFLKIKEEFKPKLDNNKVNVGIHIRGADIISADGNNGREIHSPKYYKNSIEFVEAEYDNITYHVCTDDLNFNSYTETVNYLKQKGCDFNLGNIGDYFRDFALLSECDVIIASSSTFVITAGFLGKDAKKIIHSMDWIKKNLDESYVSWGKYTNDYPEAFWRSYDNFWRGVYYNKIKYYNTWKII